MTDFSKRFLSGSGQTAFSSRFSGTAKSGRRPTSTADLRQQVSELEGFQLATGAREIEQDKPGVFAHVIDFLSRPNFAIAGFAEEILGQQPSVTQGVTRALSEIFSGVGGIQGEKRAFGQVMEELGVGTHTLAEAFPALEGTWVGNFGSRGAAGLALDIFTDPLTYMTFGAGTVGKIATSKGARFLNAAGLDELGKIRRSLIEGLSRKEAGAVGVEAVDLASKRLAKRKFGLTDDFSRRRALIDIENESIRRLEQKLGGKTGDIAEEFLDPGGVKLFGKTIPATSGLGRQFKSVVVDAMNKVPGGDVVLEKTGQWGKGLQDSINSMFHPFNELGNLPAEFRPMAIRLKRDFMSASAVHRGRLVGEAKALEKGYRALEKADPRIGERWYAIREGDRPITDIASEAERELFDKTMGLYDSMGGTAVAHGVLDPKQIRGGYIFHSYKNLDDLRRVHANLNGAYNPKSVSEVFTKERAFDKYSDAVSESRRQFEIAKSGISQGTNPLAYPELVPEFDVFKNLNRYVDLHAEGLARQSWREEVVARFGVKVDDFDSALHYEMNTSFLKPDSKGLKVVNAWFGSKGTFRELEEEAATFLRVPKAGLGAVKQGIIKLDQRTTRAAIIKTKNQGFTRSNTELGKRLAEKIRNKAPMSMEEIIEARRIVLEQKQQVEGLLSSGFPRDDLVRLKLGPEPTKTAAVQKVTREAAKFMRTLPADEKREFLRQLIVRSKSSSQLAAIERDLWDEFSEVFDSIRMRTRAVGNGEVEATLERMYGKGGAEYVHASSKFTGDQSVMMPRIILDDLNNIDSRLINTADHKGFGQVLRGFDKVNNLFKLGVYTFWPASAVRDAYSNVALSMLDIGMAALNPKYHFDAIGVMAGREGSMVAKNGIRYSWRELSKMANDFGVWVPGEVFAELTGDPRLAGTVTKAFKKAAHVRGQIENEARVMLWMQNIRRGVDPRQAADHVSEFLFNYGELNTFERQFMRRAIPFYTFTRKNVELQVKMLKRNPGMQVNQLKPFRGRNDENEGMVKFEAEALKLRLDKDGKSLHALTGIDLPLRNLDTIWKGGFGPTGRSIMGMMTPVLKVPLEVVTGRDLFTGGDMKRARADTLGRIIEATGTPKPIRDWFGYKKEVDDAGRPKYTLDGARYALVVRSWMFSRLFSTTDRQFREYLTEGDVNLWASLLDVSTGVRYKEIDMDEQERSKLFRRRRQLQDALERRGAAQSFRFTGKINTEGL